MAVYSCSALTNGGTEFRGPCRCCGKTVRFNEFGPRQQFANGDDRRDLLDQAGRRVGVKFSGAANGAVAWFYQCVECFEAVGASAATQRQLAKEAAGGAS